MLLNRFFLYRYFEKWEKKKFIKDKSTVRMPVSSSHYQYLLSVWLMKKGQQEGGVTAKAPNLSLTQHNTGNPTLVTPVHMRYLKWEQIKNCIHTLKTQHCIKYFKFLMLTLTKYALLIFQHQMARQEIVWLEPNISCTRLKVKIMLLAVKFPERV